MGSLQQVFLLVYMICTLPFETSDTASCSTTGMQIGIQTPVPQSSLLKPWRNPASAMACHASIQVTWKIQKILTEKPTAPRISNLSSLFSTGSSRLGPRLVKPTANTAHAFALKRPPRTWQRREPTIISVTQETLKPHCLTHPPLFYRLTHLVSFCNIKSLRFKIVILRISGPRDKALRCRYILR